MSTLQLAISSAEINAPVQQVWAIVSAFSSIKTWIPSISSCTATGNSLGAVRLVEWNGNTTEETLDVLDSLNHEISYLFTDSPIFPTRKARGRIKLVETENNATQITWTAEAVEYLPDTDNGTKIFVQNLLEKFIVTSIESLIASLQPAKVQLI